MERRTALNRAIEEFVSKHPEYGGAITLDAISRVIYFRYESYSVSKGFLPNTPRQEVYYWLRGCARDIDAMKQVREAKEIAERQDTLL